MSLNTVSSTSVARALLFLALPLALPLTSCFKGGSDDIGAVDTGTDTGTTEGSCEIGTEGCACTGGNGCDPGLECTGGICEPILSECGNQIVEPGEECDDGNSDNTDACTELCAPPSCDDGIISGDEIAVDCGIAACNTGCEFGDACLIANDCEFPVCGPGTEPNGPMLCQYPTSCAQWLEFTPGAIDEVITIDPDGTSGGTAQMDVFCHMSKDGGGWTLVFTGSDDNVDTWTWNNRAQLAGEATVVGDLDNTNLDFMSPAYHAIPMTDVLFIHQPSDVWAHYANVGDGVQTMGQVVVDAGSPVCNYMLAGNGYELAGGTLTASGDLCDTDLYFNLGDHETDIMSCMDFGSPSNTASFGPVWSADNGSGCPFDDPAEFGIGPHGPCGACPDNFTSTEFNYLGYANALNLNTGAQNAGENYIQMFVR